MANRFTALKIAYCIPSLYYPSGMERVLTLKANYFAEKFGYEIHIILTDGKGKMPYYQLNPSVHLHQLDINYDQLYGVSFVKRIFQYLKKQRRFKRELNAVLNDIKPDITISMLRRDVNFINRMTDGSLKIGEIHFSRANYRDFKDNRLPAFLQNIVANFWMKSLINQLKKLDSFIVLTNEDAEKWGELENVRVIPNPLPMDPKQFSDGESKQVIAAGRYMPQKGFDLLITAWKEVSRKHPDWILRIYGDGMRSELQSQIDELQLNESCFLEASVSNIEDKYAESSIFVLSSRYEGFGMVLIEAMACGVPVVSFACPCGPKDIITDHEDGLLVDPENIEQLAEKIGYLIDHKDLRQKMGRKARENVRKFTIDKVMLQWQTLFESRVEGKMLRK